MSSTTQIIDIHKIGTKGFPRHYKALGLEPPMKTVPVENGEPQTNSPEMTLQEYAAAKRWEKEVGGIEINGLTVATDDRSKTMISGARVAAMANPNFTTSWKGASGEFVPLDANAVIAISDAVLAHVSNCFAIEAQVLADIEGGVITTIEQINAAFHGANDG
ncbi:DUF4376 domain-containing protein [Ochrobactrum intermedium]|uniref:DUF4376 domain-containing protein n=1 Tax=Brucella intermedia TaxID=94625 RepID=UPI000FDE3146|nr:DUF4376 domain-containing protein [Brucella intermedia]MPR62113.1 DUF4376 domain-containing protein [Brucella intermedia]